MIKDLVDELAVTHTLSSQGLKELLTTNESLEYLYQKARETADQYYDNKIFIRGLIEFSNYCRCDCRYCGIRKSNLKAERYRLSKEEILGCADLGYDIGFRTIVLQSGEDLSYKDEDICDIVKGIKEVHPDVAVTLSVGEKDRSSYQKYYDAGADRYLLRHETINPVHYAYLHPKNQTIENRCCCLDDLKDIGYQVGCGIMVGSPHQTIDHIIEDLYYMKDFHPHMIGIGPFIPHKDTPFKDEKRGSLDLTIRILAITRLMIPDVLLPATTALATIDLKGREMGIKAGANVIMPNLSPQDVRKKYLLYDGKKCTGDEAAEALQKLKEDMQKIGYEVVTDRGDHITKK